MKLLKSFIIGLSLAFSLGFIPSTVLAAGPPSASTTIKAIDLVIGHIEEAVQSVDEGNKGEVKNHIKAALRGCKEITGAEAMEKRRLKYSRLLKKARSALKDDEMDKVKGFLEETITKFQSLKKLV